MSAAEPKVLGTLIVVVGKAVSAHIPGWADVIPIVLSHQAGLGLRDRLPLCLR